METAMDLEPLLLALRRHDASARLEPREGKPRHCTTPRCLCGHQVVLRGHVTTLGHASLDALDAPKVCERILATACSCCAAKRRAASAAAKRQQFEVARRCYTCGAVGHVVRECPLSRCTYCGGAGHLARDCRFGVGPGRSSQFLCCGDACFVRRFVVPLHRARLDFRLDAPLREGRVDVAARLVCASLVSSQRLRHNSQLWLPFLGDAARQATLCVSGGAARGLCPAETATAARIRRAIDALGGDAVSGEGGRADGEGDAGGGRGGGGEAAGDEEGGGGDEGGGGGGGGGGGRARGSAPPLDWDVRGFGLQPGGFETALSTALSHAREGGTRAPLLLLQQGAPPIAHVLHELAGGATGGGAAGGGAAALRWALRDLVVCLGDDRGLTDEETAVAERVGAQAGGGGPVYAVSLGAGCLLASQCIVILHHYLDGLHECPPRLWDAPPPEVAKLKRQQRQRRKARRQQTQPSPAEAAEEAGRAAAAGGDDSRYDSDCEEPSGA